MQPVNDCALYPDITVSAIEDEVDLTLKVVHDVPGCCWAGLAGAVCAGPGDGFVTGGDEEAGIFGRGHAEADGALAGVDVGCELRVWGDGKQDCQGAGPESGYDWLVDVGNWRSGDALKVFGAGDVGDERVVVGTTFGSEDTRDSGCIGCVGTEAVHSFSGEGDGWCDALFD